jgi:hypothetical protein
MLQSASFFVMINSSATVEHAATSSLEVTSHVLNQTCSQASPDESLKIVFDTLRKRFCKIEDVLVGNVLMAVIQLRLNTVTSRVLGGTNVKPHAR